ncbi:MAG: DUF3429 domain-containing protein [Alphaproteobacteria bacterium]|nr:DUF3429 domain-containing protein [Alphaproteobacteria bacterium]
MSRLVAHEQIPGLALGLGLAGVLPFWAAAVSQYWNHEWLPGDLAFRAGIVYGAVILSFLGGIRWGVAVGGMAWRRHRLEFALGVLPSLAGVAAVLLPEILGIALLISAFLMQALWDVMSVESGKLPKWFGTLRTLLTSGAVTALIAMLVSLVI